LRTFLVLNCVLVFFILTRPPQKYVPKLSCITGSPPRAVAEVGQPLYLLSEAQELCLASATI
jgi:hypothetical protein